MTTPPGATLKRELGVFGATTLGLGSIVGTGVFVSIGIGAGITGPAVLLAIVIAAGVATCNAFSSAQLAASHPVAGGTYEYGYRYLTPSLGFVAGWMFLCAKSASAATAALGFAGYLLATLGQDQVLLLPLGAATAVLMTVIVLAGLRRSNLINSAIVAVTLVALAVFIGVGAGPALTRSEPTWTPFFRGSDGQPGWRLFLEATALMFVAYTGYGRIATMGEEVHQPRRTIPRAIIITLVVSALLYAGVAAVAVGAVGADALGATVEGRAAPLATVAASFAVPGLGLAVAVGAMTAMLGVLLNLILGLSRVVLAMGRRRDLPAVTARLSGAGATPVVAVIVVGTIITGLACIGSVETTWSFSAFTVLVYYALTNLAALRLAPEDRIYPRWCSWVGLASCGFLACWVDWWIWTIGLGLIALGLVWHLTARTLAGRNAGPS